MPRIKTFRTRFARDIVAEFIPPRRRSRRVVILCDGMPTPPSKRQLMKFLSSRGYWVFNPRYRGSWESGGKFLKISPHRDILAVVDQLPRGFKNLNTGKNLRFRPSSIFLLGGSFGGPAVILASRAARVTAGVAYAPVVDWLSPSRDEPIEEVYDHVKVAFGEGYRLSKKNWFKLGQGKFYNPIAEASSIDGRKLLLFHARDDRSVDWRSVKLFADKTAARLILLRRGGHISYADCVLPAHWKRIKKFFAQAERK